MHWGSISTKRVRCPLIAKAAAKLIEVVVFPTPPFWLATQIVRLTLPSLVAKVSREKDFGVPTENVSRASSEILTRFGICSNAKLWCKNCAPAEVLIKKRPDFGFHVKLERVCRIAIFFRSRCFTQMRETFPSGQTIPELLCEGVKQRASCLNY